MITATREQLDREIGAFNAYLIPCPNCNHSTLNKNFGKVTA